MSEAESKLDAVLINQHEIMIGLAFLMRQMKPPGWGWRASKLEDRAKAIAADFEAVGVYARPGQ